MQMFWDTPSAFGQKQPVLRNTDKMPLRRLDQNPPPEIDRVMFRDLEEANAQVNNILSELMEVETLNQAEISKIIDQLYFIENLIYRNLK